MQIIAKEQIIILASPGSSAGSLITYLLGITQINPFDYDLLFSRFLNAGRVAKVAYDIYINGKDKIQRCL